ncbi:hypothetical protein OUZ56_008399 [Daphnia magna]|uniref:Uncharacterized protein n=1 Tax=Daphnia magna TaxID=35525 RepID=A0ABR0ACW4_9CRUS|nr:hypothetical protein OUZ56_008399 [Daphnia magna]
MSYRIELSICLSVTYRPIYLPLSFVSIQSGSTRSTVDCAFYTIHTRLPVSVYRKMFHYIWFVHSLMTDTSTH